MADLAYSSPSSGEQQSHRPSPLYALPASSIAPSLESSWIDAGGKLEEGFLSSDQEIPAFPGASTSKVVFTDQQVEDIQKLRETVEIQKLRENLSSRIPKQAERRNASASPASSTTSTTRLKRKGENSPATFGSGDAPRRSKPALPQHYSLSPRGEKSGERLTSAHSRKVSVDRQD